MADSIALNEFPGNLLTNTYILPDFAEIAYIVCAGAIPPNADKGNQAGDLSSKQSLLTRLENAEQQFRQASILVVLDRVKLELFTFYKKADILKDQQTVLRKFGQVCQSNSCRIAYKNACRITDLVKPELSRIYDLFSEALLSSLRIHGSNGSKAVNVGSRIFLLPAQSSATNSENSVRAPQTRWYLQRLDLQILPSSQLLLACRNSKWPPLTAMSDLIDPDVDPIDQGTTLYLTPVGQLARYKAKWHTLLTNDKGASRIPPSEVMEVRYRHHWIDKASDYLRRHCDYLPTLDSGTIWLEIEVPLITEGDGEDNSERALKWKTVFWPAALSYAFIHCELGDTLLPGDTDPLKLAQEWFLTGAAEARQQHLRSTDQADDSMLQESNQFFDDEPNFGSPQQFMSLPMQTFAQSQLIYPTPPDVMNTQPTPGFSVDGSAQTPLTGQAIQAGYHSSPLAAVTDAGFTEPQESAISNFLKHNAHHDDLFDVMEDSDLNRHEGNEEPNWDFFGPETLEPQSSQVGGDKLREETVPEDAEKDEMNYAEMPSSVEIPDAIAQIGEYPDQAPSMSDGGPTTNKHTLPEIAEAFPSPEAFQSSKREDIGTDKGPPVFLNHHVDDESVATTVGKHRRSSAYEVPSYKDASRDRKYAKNGKYWFEVQNLISQPPVPTALPVSSSSESSGSSLSCLDSEELAQQSHLQAWTRYEPVSAIETESHSANEVQETADYDAEIEDLLQLVTASPRQEPFVSELPTPKHHSDVAQHGAERISMCYQILTEQLAQSSLLRGADELALPHTMQPPFVDVAFTIGGSNTSLTSASLSDLSAIQFAAGNPNAVTKVVQLPPSKVRLRQADNNIAADSSITLFWETLGLQPLGGTKDLLALCICPGGDNYRQGSETFLQRVSETWSSCNLGIHCVAALKGFPTSGVISWDTMTSLLSICRKIAKALANLDNHEDCTIIYMVIPDDNLAAAFSLCNAFVEIFETLNQVEHFELGDIALQLVPASFIIGKESLAIPREDQYIGLALEVYNRIPPLMDSPETGVCAPAIVLEEPVSANLHFELSNTLISPLMRHGTCCHVAYCMSADRKWLVAAWSDNGGNVELTMSYCLFGAQGETRRPRSEVFRHICENSAQLMLRQKKKWWLSIAKVGLFDKDEYQEWMSLISQVCNEHITLSRVVLLTVEPQPRLLVHAHNTTKQAQHQTTSTFLNTPVSTPQAVNTTSPDQTVPATPSAAAGLGNNAPTPPEIVTETGADNELLLSNPQEDGWMVTFAFGLNQSYNFLEVRPAIASGILMRKDVLQGKAESHMAILGVNLIAVQRRAPNSAILPHEREQILQDILIQYYGLHTLAVARRCIDQRGTCVPWHIATAYKGARILEAFL